MTEALDSLMRMAALERVKTKTALAKKIKKAGEFAADGASLRLTHLCNVIDTQVEQTSPRRHTIKIDLEVADALAEKLGI